MREFLMGLMFFCVLWLLMLALVVCIIRYRIKLFKIRIKYNYKNSDFALQTKLQESKLSDHERHLYQIEDQAKYDYVVKGARFLYEVYIPTVKNAIKVDAMMISQDGIVLYFLYDQLEDKTPIVNGKIIENNASTWLWTKGIYPLKKEEKLLNGVSLANIAKEYLEDYTNKPIYVIFLCNKNVDTSKLNIGEYKISSYKFVLVATRMLMLDTLKCMTEEEITNLYDQLYPFVLYENATWESDFKNLAGESNRVNLRARAFLCPQCGGTMEEHSERISKHIVKWYYTCRDCGYHEEDEHV